MVRCARDDHLARLTDHHQRFSIAFNACHERVLMTSSFSIQPEISPDFFLRLRAKAAQHARRVSVGSDAKRIGAVDFEKIGQLFEDLGYFVILHRVVRCTTSISVRQEFQRVGNSER